MHITAYTHSIGSDQNDIFPYEKDLGMVNVNPILGHGVSDSNWTAGRVIKDKDGKYRVVATTSNGWIAIGDNKRNAFDCDTFANAFVKARQYDTMHQALRAFFPPGHWRR